MASNLNTAYPSVAGMNQEVVKLEDSYLYFTFSATELPIFLTLVVINTV